MTLMKETMMSRKYPRIWITARTLVCGYTRLIELVQLQLVMRVGWCCNPELGLSNFLLFWYQKSVKIFIFLAKKSPKLFFFQPKKSPESFFSCLKSVKIFFFIIKKVSKIFFFNQKGLSNLSFQLKSVRYIFFS